MLLEQVEAIPGVIELILGVQVIAGELGVVAATGLRPGSGKTDSCEPQSQDGNREAAATGYHGCFRNSVSGCESFQWYHTVFVS